MLLPRAPCDLRAGPTFRSSWWVSKVPNRGFCAQADPEEVEEDAEDCEGRDGEDNSGEAGDLAAGDDGEEHDYGVHVERLALDAGGQEVAF